MHKVITYVPAFAVQQHPDLAAGVLSDRPSSLGWGIRIRI